MSHPGRWMMRRLIVIPVQLEGWLGIACFSIIELEASIAVWLVILCHIVSIRCRGRALELRRWSYSIRMMRLMKFEVLHDLRANSIIALSGVAHPPASHDWVK